MKSTLEDLKARRSIRRYRPTQIKREELDAILEAGTYAPTAHGKQSPIMVVAQDAPTIGQLSRMNAEALGRSDLDPFYGAPTVVIVLADKNVPTCRYDGSLVLGNLMNAAHALGVGSCWINRAREMFETEEGKSLLKKWGVEGEYEGIGVCILGYADEPAPAPQPRKEGYIIRV